MADAADDPPFEIIAPSTARTASANCPFAISVQVDSTVSTSAKEYQDRMAEQWCLVGVYRFVFRLQTGRARLDFQA
jgi:hypothetical protein